MTDDEARRLAVELELIAEGEELRMRREALYDTLRDAVVVVGTLPAVSARRCWDALVEDARELEALDSTAAEGIRHLGRALVAAQFEACGGARLRELGVSLHED